MPPHERFEQYDGGGPSLSLASSSSSSWNLIGRDDHDDHSHSHSDEEEEEEEVDAAAGNVDDASLSSSPSSIGMDRPIAETVVVGDGWRSVLTRQKDGRSAASFRHRESLLCVLLAVAAFASGYGCRGWHVSSLVASVHLQAQALQQCLEDGQNAAAGRARMEMTCTCPSSDPLSSCPACPSCPVPERMACAETHQCPNGEANADDAYDIDAHRVHSHRRAKKEKMDCPSCPFSPPISDVRLLAILLNSAKGALTDFDRQIKAGDDDWQTDLRALRMALYDLELAVHQQQQQQQSPPPSRSCGGAAETDEKPFQEAMDAFSLLSKSARDGFRKMMMDSNNNSNSYHHGESHQKSRKTATDGSDGDSTPLEDAMSALHGLSKSARSAFAKWMESDGTGGDCRSGDPPSPLPPSLLVIKRMRKAMVAFDRLEKRKPAIMSNGINNVLDHTIGRAVELVEELRSNLVMGDEQGDIGGTE